MEKIPTEKFNLIEFLDSEMFFRCTYNAGEYDLPFVELIMVSCKADHYVYIIKLSDITKWNFIPTINCISRLEVINNKLVVSTEASDNFVIDAKEITLFRLNKTENLNYPKILTTIDWEKIYTNK